MQNRPSTLDRDQSQASFNMMPLLPSFNSWNPWFEQQDGAGERSYSQYPQNPVSQQESPVPLKVSIQPVARSPHGHPNPVVCGPSGVTCRVLLEILEHMRTTADDVETQTQDVHRMMDKLSAELVRPRSFQDSAQVNTLRDLVQVLWAERSQIRLFTSRLVQLLHEKMDNALVEQRTIVPANEVQQGLGIMNSARHSSNRITESSSQAQISLPSTRVPWYSSGDLGLWLSTRHMGFSDLMGFLDASTRAESSQSVAGGVQSRTSDAVVKDQGSKMQFPIALEESDLSYQPKAKRKRTRRGSKDPEKFKFNCNSCEKSFTRSSTLQEHVRTHSNERPFACSHCKLSFSRLKDRNRHQDLHTGEKKFICSGMLSKETIWGCGRQFAREDSLVTHLRTARGSRCFRHILDNLESYLTQPGEKRDDKKIIRPRCNETFGIEKMKVHPDRSTGKTCFVEWLIHQALVLTRPRQNVVLASHAEPQHRVNSNLSLPPNQQVNLNITKGSGPPYLSYLPDTGFAVDLETEKNIENAHSESSASQYISQGSEYSSSPTRTTSPALLTRQGKSYPSVTAEPFVEWKVIEYGYEKSYIENDRFWVKVQCRTRPDDVRISFAGDDRVDTFINFLGSCSDVPKIHVSICIASSQISPS